MTVKDPRFRPKTIEEERKAKPITGKEIRNDTILTGHLANKSITTEKLADYSITTEKLADSSISGSKLQELSFINPVHTGDDLSLTTSGWVRIAQLQNRSAVEFWLRVNTSGNHNIAKFIGTYSFMGGGSPQVSFNMLSNARYGNGFTDVRIIYKSTYDIIYFEIFLPQTATIVVSQSSAFGNTLTGFSNIILIAGSIPTGYSTYPVAPVTFNLGSYDSGVITI